MPHSGGKIPVTIHLHLLACLMESITQSLNHSDIVTFAMWLLQHRINILRLQIKYPFKIFHFSGISNVGGSHFTSPPPVRRE